MQLTRRQSACTATVISLATGRLKQPTQEEICIFKQHLSSVDEVLTVRHYFADSWILDEVHAKIPAKQPKFSTISQPRLSLIMPLELFKRYRIVMRDLSELLNRFFPQDRIVSCTLLGITQRYSAPILTPKIPGAQRSRR
jgi:hypothetical protein